MGVIMIPEELKLPLIDFADKISKMPNLIGVILFGSAVTGDMSKKSDVDLLLVFDTDHDPEMGKEAEIVQEISSDISAVSSPMSAVSFRSVELPAPGAGSFCFFGTASAANCLGVFSKQRGWASA